MKTASEAMMRHSSTREIASHTRSIGASRCQCVVRTYCFIGAALRSWGNERRTALERLALESGDALVFFHEGGEFFPAHHVFDAPERLVAGALVHHAQDDVGRDRAACEHDFVRGLEPRVFIRPKRGDAVALACKA